MKPLFQRRHYEVLAKALRDSNIKQSRSDLTDVMITALKRDNPNFNESKFWRAVDHG